MPEVHLNQHPFTLKTEDCKMLMAQIDQQFLTKIARLEEILSGSKMVYRVIYAMLEWSKKLKYS